MLVLGKGSNIIADDSPLPYVIVKTFPYGKPLILSGVEKDGGIIIKVDASMPLPRLIAWANKIGLGDLTHLTGIPGDVGGAFMMNAGSYDSNFCDFIESAEIVSLKSGHRIVRKSDIVSQYRKTSIKGIEDSPIIISVNLKLYLSDQKFLRHSSKEIMKKKATTQPVYAKSAGCVFKNPNGISAGQLLDNLGFRGKSCGGMSFSFIHANFLVNTAYGKSEQAFSLIRDAKEVARCRCGIELHEEVKILSC